MMRSRLLISCLITIACISGCYQTLENRASNAISHATEAIVFAIELKSDTDQNVENDRAEFLIPKEQEQFVPPLLHSWNNRIQRSVVVNGPVLEKLKAQIRSGIAEANKSDDMVSSGCIGGDYAIAFSDNQTKYFYQLSFDACPNISVFIDGKLKGTVESDITPKELLDEILNAKPPPSS